MFLLMLPLSSNKLRNLFAISSLSLLLEVLSFNNFFSPLILSTSSVTSNNSLLTLTSFTSNFSNLLLSSIFFASLVDASFDILIIYLSSISFFFLFFSNSFDKFSIS